MYTNESLFNLSPQTLSTNKHPQTCFEVFLYFDDFWSIFEAAVTSSWHARIDVSSVNIERCVSWVFGISAVKMMYRIGPRTLLWSTPAFIWKILYGRVRLGLLENKFCLKSIISVDGSTTEGRFLLFCRVISCAKLCQALFRRQEMLLCNTFYFLDLL